MSEESTTPNLIELARAIRRFLTDWWAAYDASAAEAEEIVDFGNGVTLAVIVFNGVPLGAAGTSDGGWLATSAVDAWCAMIRGSNDRPAY
jgi:hypothetical protein